MHLLINADGSMAVDLDKLESIEVELCFHDGVQHFHILLFTAMRIYNFEQYVSQSEAKGRLSKIVELANMR